MPNLKDQKDIKVIYTTFFSQVKEIGVIAGFVSQKRVFHVPQSCCRLQNIFVAILHYTKEYSVRRDKLSQALNCSCTSELNTGAFTIKLIVNAAVYNMALIYSDVQLNFSA